MSWIKCNNNMCYENDNYNKKDESWSCIKRVSRTRNSNIQLWICGQFNVLLLLHCGYVVLIIDINHIVSPSFVCSSHDYHKHEQNNHLISEWKLIVCHCNSILIVKFYLVMFIITKRVYRFFSSKEAFQKFA